MVLGFQVTMTFAMYIRLITVNFRPVMTLTCERDLAWVKMNRLPNRR